MNKADQPGEVAFDETLEAETPAIGADPAMWNAGMGAASGALAGAVGGPVCAMLGAAVGAFAGGVGMAESDEKPSGTGEENEPA